MSRLEMSRLKRFLKRWRLPLGYLLVAAVFGPLLLLGLDHVPDLEALLLTYGITLESKEWLALVGAVPLLWFVRLHTLTDLPWFQQLLSVTLRSVLLIALAAALTRPVLTREEGTTAATVFVVDVSASVSDESLTRAHDAVEAAWRARGEGSVHLITFAREAQVVTLTPVGSGLAPIARAEGDAALGSDLESAVRLGYSLFPPEVVRRMVVATDGNETRGNALAESATAAKLGIRVSYLSAPNAETPGELIVESLDIPAELEVNIPFLASTVIRASRPTPTKCTLTLDGTEVQTVEAEAGREPVTVDFPDVRVKEGGERAFSVRCVAAEGHEDRVATNNRFDATRQVPKKKKLLYLEGEALYARNFRDAMADDFEVEVRGANGLPRSLEELQEFKAIVISDVPVEGAYFKQNISTAQMRLLHEYAKAGGFLLFTGGQDSLGPGGYTGTYLEKQVLPVNLEIENELETPRLALVLAMDRSGSMAARNLELAKKAARDTVAVLDKRDTVGIVAFDTEARKLIGLTPATSKARFDRALATLTPGGGTNIGEALGVSLEMLEGVEAQIKHVILMTDGQSDSPGVEAMVRAAAAQGITVSTVGFGRGAARAFLARIAEAGRGRAHYTEDVEALPRLFVDETREVAGESVKQEPVKVLLNAQFAKLRFLDGISIGGAPTLDGYVPVEAKRGTETILKLSSGDPLLVRWQRGKGWVVVFTSDLKNKWARRWLKWPDFAPFWRQLVKDGMPKEEKDTVYPMALAVRHGKLTVSADAIDDQDAFVSGLQSSAVVTYPSGRTETVVLAPSAPGRYEATVTADEYGPYKVEATHQRDGQKLAISSARYANPYPEELLHFEPDLSRVAELADATHGRENPTPEWLFDTEGISTRKTAPVWHYPLYLVVFALAVDVLLRRVRLWKAGMLTWGGQRV